MACEGSCACKPEDQNIEISSKNEASDSIDDVWGSDDEENDYAILNADIRRAHHKQGYLDGLSKAKETGLQRGFDTAFPQGAALGIRVGIVLSLVYTKCKGETDLFKQAEQELNITRVLHSNHFDADLNLNEVHEVLVKWEAIASS